MLILLYELVRRLSNIWRCYNEPFLLFGMAIAAQDHHGNESSFHSSHSWIFPSLEGNEETWRYNKLTCSTFCFHWRALSHHLSREWFTSTNTPFTELFWVTNFIAMRCFIVMYIDGSHANSQSRVVWSVRIIFSKTCKICQHRCDIASVIITINLQPHTSQFIHNMKSTPSLCAYRFKLVMWTEAIKCCSLISR